MSCSAQTIIKLPSVAPLTAELAQGLLSVFTKNSFPTAEPEALYRRAYTSTLGFGRLEADTVRKQAELDAGVDRLAKLNASRLANPGQNGSKH